MDIVVDRDNEPLKVQVTAGSFSAEELAAVFDREDADTENLFFAIFGRKWRRTAISRRYALLSELAARIENAQAQSVAMSAGAPEHE